eukprot:CAMPEP_0179872998 /NCGR_PEP_ID=MMETSP0982-20121206/21863_1 /TAXON_ID=483367 /ORGANISM="non described non described, Strain CCMP 2436" /LENGTH=100 /DNA_ID=CAMNT_0021764183 /DNA_START=281 /DNA_END=582 /DNA_ORIENTATION=-
MPHTQSTTSAHALARSKVAAADAAQFIRVEVDARTERRLIGRLRAPHEELRLLERALPVEARLLGSVDGLGRHGAEVVHVVPDGGGHADVGFPARSDHTC